MVTSWGRPREKSIEDVREICLWSAKWETAWEFQRADSGCWLCKDAFIFLKEPHGEILLLVTILSRRLVLKMWSLDKEYQHHMESCWFPHQSFEWKLYLTNLTGDSNTCSGVRTTASRYEECWWRSMSNTSLSSLAFSFNCWHCVQIFLQELSGAHQEVPWSCPTVFRHELGLKRLVV
jgi:hypothetical protein